MNRGQAKDKGNVEGVRQILRMLTSLRLYPDGLTTKYSLIACSSVCVGIGVSRVDGEQAFVKLLLAKALSGFVHRGADKYVVQWYGSSYVFDGSNQAPKSAHNY